MRKAVHGGLRAGLLGLAIVMLQATAVQAAGDAEWAYPGIPGFGKVMPAPRAGVQPDKNTQYKVVYNVNERGEPEKLNPALDKLARSVNIFASAGVPLSNLHFIGVVHGPATFALLDNEHYRERFQVDNPNLKLLEALDKAGVKVMVCAQALANLKLQPEWVDPKVQVTLSAISDFVLLQQQGYVFVPL
jgi:intracellular sulfur oxidation DsrE/DsrF family protein